MGPAVVQAPHHHHEEMAMMTLFLVIRRTVFPRKSVRIRNIRDSSSVRARIFFPGCMRSMRAIRFFPMPLTLVFGNNCRVIQIEEFSAHEPAQAGSFKIIVDVFIDNNLVSPDKTDHPVVVLRDQTKRFRLFHLAIEIGHDFARRPVIDKEDRLSACGA